jgi:hypothetical protein
MFHRLLETSPLTGGHVDNVFILSVCGFLLHAGKHNRLLLLELLFANSCLISVQFWKNYMTLICVLNSWTLINLCNWCVKFDVLLELNKNITVYTVTPCSLVESYLLFGVSCFIHLQGIYPHDGDCSFLRNVSHLYTSLPCFASQKIIILFAFARKLQGCNDGFHPPLKCYKSKEV